MSVDLEAFARDRQHLGVRRAFLRAAYYRLSGRTSLSVYRIVVLTLDSVNRELLERETPYSIRPLGVDELEVFSADPANQLPPEFVALSAETKDVCIGVLDGDELASFGWYSERPTVVEDGSTIHFCPSRVYMFHGHTKPEYRGRNLHGLGLARAVQIFDERGYAGVLSLADWANYASLISAYRSGFRNCGVALRFGRGARPWFWASPGCRRYGVRFERGGARLYGAPS